MAAVRRLFTKRNAPPPDKLRYDIPEQIRTRILAVFEDHVDPQHGLGGLLSDVGKMLFKEYGGLYQSAYEMARRSDNPVIEHFYLCDDGHAIDFIEACFQQWPYSGRQQGVDEINGIFREHGIGYELTPYVEHEVEKEVEGRFGKRKQKYIETDYPQVIRLDSQLAHQEIVRPMLHLLSDSRLRVANREMLDALFSLRSGQWDDAITSSCSAFESLLKTICDLKGWAYDPNRDTCSRLVAICRDNGLFPAFYVPLFEAVGTIRNRLGDAHGRGPAPSQSVDQRHAEHMVRMTSAHMLLIAELAGLSL